MEPENPAALAKAVTALAAMRAEDRAEMARRGRAFYLRELSFDHGVSRFASVLSTLAGGKAGAQDVEKDPDPRQKPPV